MSSKEKYIQHIRGARTHQHKWINQIKLMVSGVTLDKEAVPVNQSDSDFSRWLYSDAMAFSTSNAKNIIDEMIELHTKCYDIYLKIYGTLFAGKTGGIMAVFGPKKASASELKLAQNYYEELLPASDRLLSKLRTFESLMLATQESKFDELLVEQEREDAAPEQEAPEHPAAKQKL
ncbi:MAG: hypothetical protein P8Y65_10355, partial [Campylobacterales bacterium]